jgi:phosphoglycerol transferase
LDAGNPPPETYLRVVYDDPVKLGVANIHISKYSPLNDLIRTGLLVLAGLSLIISLSLFLWFCWPSVRRHTVEIIRPPAIIDPNRLMATILIFIVGLGVLFRNLVVNYPLIFGDEGIFLIRAKYAGRPYMLAGNELAAWVPNSLYLWLNHSIFFLGANYAIGARLINVLFLVVSLMVLYAIAALFVSSRKAALAAVAVGVGPMSIYTAFVMPETMFLCAFLCLAFVLIRHIGDRPIYAGFLSGITLGAASLIKPHGLMLIPIVLLVLLALKLSVREWCRWTTCAAAAGIALGSAFATIGILNYLISGKFGFSLGPAYSMVVNRSTAASSIASILYVIAGHVALVLSLYALPMLVVLMTLCRGVVATGSLPERIQLKALLIFTVLAGFVLLITTSKFTVSVVGLSPYEQLNRVHVRYYFFVLPLLLVLFLAVYERLDWTKMWVRKIFVGGCIGMCAFTAFCILVLDRRYSLYFPDFPDGFWFNTNSNIGRLVILAGTCGMLLAYAWRTMSPTVFLCTFGFVSLAGNYYISRFVIQPATITDRAAAVFEKIIGRERLDAGTVFDTEPGDGEVYRLLFDLPAAYDLKVVTNPDPIAADKLPDQQEWALVTSAREVKFPYAESLIFGRYHLYLRIAQPGMTSEARQTELAPGDPFLTGACVGGQLIGFQAPESWGVWSAEDPAKILLPREVRGRFHLVLVSNVLGKERQSLQVQMDNSVKTIVLGAEPTTSQLDFDLPTPTQNIVLRGITLQSPFQLGISADVRRLGFAIDKLDCTVR